MTSCECCGGPRGPVDSEGICQRCWREGVAWANGWIGDLRFACTDAEIESIIGSPIPTVRALGAHVLETICFGPAVAYAGRDAGVPMRRSAL